MDAQRLRNKKSRARVLLGFGYSFCAQVFTHDFWARLVVSTGNGLTTNHQLLIKSVYFCANNTRLFFLNNQTANRRSDLRVIPRLLVRRHTFALAVLSCLASHGEILGDERLYEAVHLRPLRWEHFIARLGLSAPLRSRQHCADSSMNVTQLRVTQLQSVRGRPPSRGLSLTRSGLTSSPLTYLLRQRSPCKGFSLVTFSCSGPQSSPLKR